MLKSKVIDHYKNQTAVAEALGITQGAVSQWPEVIPEHCARDLDDLTHGELEFNKAYYRTRRFGPKQDLSKPKSKGKKKLKPALSSPSNQSAA